MSDVHSNRETFFKLVFGSNQGYVCVAHKEGAALYEEYFKYPDDLPQLLKHIHRHYLQADVYFCPQLLNDSKRIKENVITCPTVWADLDTCSPDNVEIKPSVVLETSKGRYQAFWRLTKPAAPEDGEDASRRLAYAYHKDGADKTGWDLTQLLRVPLTLNHKYDPPASVAVRDASTISYKLEDFERFPQVTGFEYLDIPMPDSLEGMDAKTLIAKYRGTLNPIWSQLFYEEPDPYQEGGWSKNLWRLYLTLFDSGLSRDEVFVIAQEAACNKFQRDGRPPIYLWKDVCRAESYFRHTPEDLDPTQNLGMPTLLLEEERDWVENHDSFIEEYVNWASSLGDAAPQYHEVGAFVILSALMSGTVRLPTSYGTLLPNLWFMILADTTLTRKSTAMDVAVDLVLEVDPDCLLATDGSIEGLFTSISMRPGRPSIFLRDEVSGLLEAMAKKDYYAGMAETLTKLYDGKYQKRVLRREVIEVRDPVLILFTGGIKTRVLELLRYEHVGSGFVPRFLFVSAESDITRLRPLGPPSEANLERRLKLIEQLREIYNHYHQHIEIKVGDKTSTVQQRWDVKMSEEAWAKYNVYEATLVGAGLDSNLPEMLTPTFDRLAKSGLKMATLLAAARTRDRDVVIEDFDIMRAFYYIERWGVYTIELIQNLGKTASERLLDKVLRGIKRSPGVSRSKLMQNYHLEARTATNVFDTLEQRGLIRKEKQGKGDYYYPVGV